MSTSSRWAGLALCALAASLIACSDEEGPFLSGNRFAPPSAAPSDAPDPTPDATPSPSPTPAPTIQGLLVDPSDVSLSSDPEAPPTSRGINLSAIALLSNQDRQPTTAQWSAAPPGRVEVNAWGYVSAIAHAPAGTVIVTATSGSFQATASVRVTAKPLTVTGVTLSSAELSLFAPASDGENTAGLPTTAALSAVVTMSDGSTASAVTWSSSDVQVARVSAGGLVTTVGAGSATLTAKASQDPSRAASCPITVKAQGLVDVTVE